MNVHSLSFVGNKTLATILIASFIFATGGFTMWSAHTEAAALTVVSDLLSDSDLGALSNHTIVFSSVSGIALGETVTITFADEFNVSTGTLAVATDIDIDHGSGDLVVVGVACGTPGDDVSASVAAQTITLEFCTGEGGVLAAGGTTTIEIGSHAASGVGDIVNPTSAQSYVVSIGGTMTDSADTRVAIIDDVDVTAVVETTFLFQIFGMPAGYLVNGSVIGTASTTLPTLLPFGVLAVDTESTLAQNLRVSTNATNGFTVTLNQDQNLTSSGGDDIDRFADDSGVGVPAVWAAPSGNLGSENEYGHMGITSEDATLFGGDDFGSDLWAGNFVNNAREVFYHDGPADGITTHQGSTTVGFQAEIMAFQEAGNDYAATITYVATPVF